MKIIKHFTLKQLWDAAMETVKEDSFWKYNCDILDYTLFSDTPNENLELTSYEFDVVAITKVGGNEGIYSSIVVDGIVQHEADCVRHSIGTLKTLHEGKEAYLKMAALSNLLAYHLSDVVGKNLNRFEADDVSRIGCKVQASDGEKHGAVTVQSILEKKPVLIPYQSWITPITLEPTPELLATLAQKALDWFGMSCLTPSAWKALTSLVKRGSENEKQENGEQPEIKTLYACSFDDFAYACPFFTSECSVNNGYGCTHSEQRETDFDRELGKEHGKCYCHSCPLGIEADQESRDDPKSVDWNDIDDTEIGEAEYILVRTDGEISSDASQALLSYLRRVNRYNDSYTDRLHAIRRHCEASGETVAALLRMLESGEEDMS